MQTIHANEQLIGKYREWLDQIRADAPELLGKKYSNPYFSSIPEGWFEASGPRIMVVGEEGFGDWGCGKGDGSISADDVEAIQRFNFIYLRQQTGLSDAGRINNGAFWRRFRKIAEHGVCSWTNIDKIHVLDRSKCALNAEERGRLHCVKMRILHEEITLLNPTHVIFFGWYGISLRHELPQVYAQMYPKGPRDKSVWNKTVVPVRQDGRSYIFSYHPNWGCRQNGYEDLVMKVFQDQIQKAR